VLFPRKKPFFHYQQFYLPVLLYVGFRSPGIFFEIGYLFHLHFQCYPKSPPHAPPPTHSHFLALEFPCTEPYKVCKTNGPLFPLMADQVLVLVSSYCCFTYRIADPFSSLGTFSSSSIGSPVIHPLADCEHPLLCLLGPGIVSQETATSGSFR
jgi:putative lipoic acid-binding regulatory protein